MRLLLAHGAIPGNCLSAACLWSVLACGCVTVKTAPPPRETPAAFEHHTGTTGATWPAKEWYRGFGSDELNALVELAVSNNADLGAARARVAQADARARQAGAAILPAIDANGNATYMAGHSQQGSGHEFDWFAMLSASYEVDFWGKNRATAQAAILQASASRADRDTVALTLLGGVADEYFAVLALRERIAIARENSDTAQKVLAAVQARFDVGVASPVDLASQKAAFDATRIALSDLDQSEVEARGALALLLGRVPEKFDVSGTSLEPVRELAVAPGLPAELLARRPDVAMAEANLQAASADLTAARAAMLPSLSLTASGGVQNPALPATVLTIGGVGASLALAANVTQPIFDHGRLRAKRDESAAREQELIAAYRAAVVAALVDVEKALSALEHLNAVEEFQRSNVSENGRAFEGARLRYEHGSGDFLTLLEAQRTLFAARDQFTQFKLARLQGLVALCKALGGGWSTGTVARQAPTHSPADLVGGSW